MGTYKGKVENGKIVFQGRIPLPEGTHVSVTPIDEVGPVYRIGNDAVETGAADLAEEHDHYAYGTPKRKTTPEK